LRPTDYRDPTRLTRPTCKGRREPRPDLLTEHKANPDLACLQGMDRTQIKPC